MGLTPEELARRLVMHGANELPRADGPTAGGLFVSQFHRAMTWLLALACVVAVLLGEAADAVAIAAFVLLNGTITFLQEFRAAKAVRALRAPSAPRATVLRDSASLVWPARETVPGDLLLLEAGLEAARRGLGTPAGSNHSSKAFLDECHEITGSIPSSFTNCSNKLATSPNCAGYR
jgi:magnesium-transporting ATPase (P-type)